jgi:hypothetical protein
MLFSFEGANAVVICVLTVCGEVYNRRFVVARVEIIVLCEIRIFVGKMKAVDVAGI